MKPFGFHEYNNLQINSFCVISDSGTIAEASILNLLLLLKGKPTKDQRVWMKLL